MYRSRQQCRSRGLRGVIVLSATAAVVVGAMTSEVSAQGAFSRGARARQAISTDAAPEAPNAGSAFGSALIACDKEAGAAPDQIALPGIKGDMKLDKCYRGRDHLVCNVNVLTKEATALSQEFGKVIDAGYPDKGNIGAVCAIQPDDLGSDMKRANEFTNRFRALKAAYTARMSCTGRIQIGRAHV